MKHPIPTFEPEVIAAGAAKRWGNDEKVATTSISSLTVNGIKLSSRYDKAYDFEAMAKMVEALPPHLPRFVRSIWCDTQACAFYHVGVLAECTVAIAEEIGRALEEASGGHNGIWITVGEKRSWPLLYERGPEWFEDFGDI